jgi:hypothetical protein
MIECMLASDSGVTGNVVTVLYKVYYDHDYISYFDIRIFSKEIYEYYEKPRKLNSYLYQLKSGARIDLGLTVIVATQKPKYNWALLDYSYNTFGVPGIATPIGAIDAKIFYKP